LVSPQPSSYRGRQEGAQIASELIVVENFFEELKAKVGN